MSNPLRKLLVARSIPLPPWQVDAFAIFITIATLGFRLALDSHLRSEPTLVMFTVPIMISAYAGGLRAGLVATGLSYVLASHYLLPPFHSLMIADPAQRWNLFFVTLAGVVVSVLNEALHRARRRSDVATHARHAQVALVKAEALQSAIFNSVNFASIATDAAGVIQVFNVGAERMLGFKAAEVVDVMTPAELSDPRELLIRAQSLSEELGTPIAPGFEALAFKATRGIEDIYEMTYVRKDASRLSRVVSVTALRDAHDEIIGYHIIGTDNTARKLADEARRTSEARYRTLFEYAPDGIVVADPESYYLDANASICRMLGFTRAELVGLHASAIVAEPEIQNIGHALGAIAGTSDYRREWEFRRKDGSTFAAEVIATKMPDGNLLALIHDVTERKRIEARFRRLVDSNAQGVMFWNKQGDIVSAKDAFLRVVGYTRDDLNSGNVARAMLTPTKYAHLDLIALEELAKTGVCTPYEKEYIRKDGSLVPVTMGAATFEDNPDEGVCFVLDISARRQFEDNRKFSINGCGTSSSTHAPLSNPTSMPW